MIPVTLSMLVGMAVLTIRLYARKNKGLKKESYERNNLRGLPDYNKYEMTATEKYVCRFIGTAFFFSLAYIFYQRIGLALLIAPIGLLYPRIRTKAIIKKRKRELNNQFKDALYSLASSLNAGISFEMAIKGVIKDLSLMYPDPEAFIISEFLAIHHKLEMNETVEEGLIDLAKRAHLEDIDNFVDVFIISKRSGGNLLQIIQNTSDIINEKIMLRQEIETLLAQRKYEQKVLNIMPPLLIVFLSWSTGDYMEPIFSSAQGRLLMTVAFILLGAAYYLSAKIMSIEV